MDLHEAAPGIREVANNQMADLLRRVTLRPGYDPRDFVLFAYGGAGPTHAYQYAAFAGISNGRRADHRLRPLRLWLRSPPTGTARSRLRSVSTRRRASRGRPTTSSAETLNEGFERARAAMPARRSATTPDQAASSACGSASRCTRSRSRCPPEDARRRRTSTRLVDRFEQKYERIYGKGTALRGSGVEFIVLRVEGSSPVQRPQAGEAADARPQWRSRSPAAAVYFYGKGFVETPVYRSDDLGPGDRSPVRPSSSGRTRRSSSASGQRAEVDPYGNVIIHLGNG